VEKQIVFPSSRKTPRQKKTKTDDPAASGVHTLFTVTYQLKIPP